MLTVDQDTTSELSILDIDPRHYADPLQTRVDIMPTDSFTGDFDKIIPRVATNGSAAVDLRSSNRVPVMIKAGETHMIPTGIRMHLRDPNVAAMLLPRSGMGHHQGIVLGNLTGLIDPDYQGEVLISCWNRSTIDYELMPGTRLAQMMFVPKLQPVFNVVKEFDLYTERGEGGFNSTGTD